jgi:hypothetical protein
MNAAKPPQDPFNAAARPQELELAALESARESVSVRIGKYPSPATVGSSAFGFFDCDLTGRDFAQRGNHFFVVRFHQRPRTLEQLFRAARRAEHQLEAVGDVVEAIFYGYSCHCPSILRCAAALVNAHLRGSFHYYFLRASAAHGFSIEEMLEHWALLDEAAMLRQLTAN